MHISLCKALPPLSFLYSLDNLGTGGISLPFNSYKHQENLHRQKWTNPFCLSALIASPEPEGAWSLSTEGQVQCQAAQPLCRSPLPARMVL